MREDVLLVLDPERWESPREEPDVGGGWGMMERCLSTN